MSRRLLRRLAALVLLWGLAAGAGAQTLALSFDDEAWADPVYGMKPVTLPAGESILWSLARQDGVEGLRYPAEDDVYEKPILDALGL